MEPEDVVTEAFRALGKGTVLIPGGVNKLMRFVTTRLIPRRTSVAMWGLMMSRATDEALM